MTEPTSPAPARTSAGTSPGRLDPGRGRPHSWSTRTRHPVRLAVGLVLAPGALTLLVAALMAVAAPGSSQSVRRLAAVLVVAAAAVLVVVVTGARWRTATGGPASWRHLGLLVVPLLIAAAPVVVGFDLPGAATAAVLVAGYAATGVYEEVWHRGVVLDVLRGLGLRRSVLVGGALFGGSHLLNIAFGQSPAISVAQAVGATCFGIGFGIYRWRTAAVWLLAALHAFSDLMLKITNLHGALMWAFLVGNDVLMLAWALWCLRGTDDDVSAA